MQKDWDKTPERQRKSDAKAGHPGQLPSAKQMESAGETKPADVLVHPIEAQRRSPVNGTQATAILLRPAQTASTSARSGRPQLDRQATARTHRSEPSLQAKSTTPGHANQQRPNANRQGTHGRSDQE